MTGRTVEFLRKTKTQSTEKAKIVGKKVAEKTPDRVKKAVEHVGEVALTAANDVLYSALIGKRIVDLHIDVLGEFRNGDLEPETVYELGSSIDVSNDEPQPMQHHRGTMAKTGKVIVMPAFDADPFKSGDPDHPGDFTMPDPETTLTRHRGFQSIFDRFVKSNRRFKDVRTADDFIQVLSSRRAVGLMKAVEGIYVTDGNHEQIIDSMIDDGYRLFGPLWNFDSGVGHTTKPAVRKDAEDKGLTELGEKVVARIDEKGGIVDLAHSSDKTIWDILKIPSNRPRVDSHAGSRAIVPHNRNITDDVAKLIINGGRFVQEGDTYRVLGKDEKAKNEYTVTGGGLVGMPMVKTFAGENTEKVVNQLRHFKDIGVLHGIALGTDFDGMGEGSVVEGAENAKVFRKNLRREMRNQGFTRKEIRGVFSENALRFWLKNLPGGSNDLPTAGDVFTPPPAAPLAA